MIYIQISSIIEINQEYDKDLKIGDPNLEKIYEASNWIRDRNGFYFMGECDERLQLGG